MNILIVPGTTLIAKEICNSLCYSKNLQLFGAGFDINATAEFPYVAYDFLTTLDSNLPISDLEQIIGRRLIDFVILAHDDWIYRFRDIEFISNAKVLKQLSSTIEIASIKSKTYELLRGVVPTPEVFSSPIDVTKFPIFIKPDRGQGSIGAVKINSIEETLRYLKPSEFFQEKWVVSEFLPGDEFTVDCFSDQDFGILYSSVRIRNTIDFGLATDTKILENTDLENWANRISQKLQIKGPWFFQAKEDSEKTLKLTEVGIRVAGASGVQRLKGINLSLMSLLQAQGFPILVIDQNTHPRRFAKTFDLGFHFELIFVDYDDTLVLNSGLNEVLFEFLFEKKRENMEIVLITRSTFDFKKSLEFPRVAGLLTKVLQVGKNDNKSDFIDTDKNFLFIDDSFRERLDVARKFGKQVLVLDESFLVG